MTDTPTDLLIYHLFADEGVESDYLDRFGWVVRVGLDPTDRNGSEPVRGDVTDLPLRPDADLAVAHPPCGPWNVMNAVHGNQDEQPELVEEAREVCERVADHYVIENVPAAPLRDPVVLQGSHFGLPITKKRAFETSFDVPQPHLQQPLVDHVENFDRYDRPREWWESVMGDEYEQRDSPTGYIEAFEVEVGCPECSCPTCVDGRIESGNTVECSTVGCEASISIVITSGGGDDA